MPPEVKVVLNALLFFSIRIQSTDGFEVYDFIKESRGKFQLAIPDLIREEYESEARKHGYSIEEVNSLLNQIWQECRISKKASSSPERGEIRHLPSSHEGIVLGACRARANFLITVYPIWLENDRLKQELKRSYNLKVVSPGEFLQEMGRR